MLALVDIDRKHYRVLRLVRLPGGDDAEVHVAIACIEFPGIVQTLAYCRCIEQVAGSDWELGHDLVLREGHSTLDHGSVNPILCAAVTKTEISTGIAGGTDNRSAIRGIFAVTPGIAQIVQFHLNAIGNLQQRARVALKCVGNLQPFGPWQILRDNRKVMDLDRRAWLSRGSLSHGRGPQKRQTEKREWHSHNMSS